LHRENPEKKGERRQVAHADTEQRRWKKELIVCFLVQSSYLDLEVPPVSQGLFLKIDNLPVAFGHHR
jgi:hypothetical protein